MAAGHQLLYFRSSCQRRGVPCKPSPEISTVPKEELFVTTAHGVVSKLHGSGWGWGEREKERKGGCTSEEEAFRFTPTENIVMEKIVKYGMCYSPQIELIMLGNRIYSPLQKMAKLWFSRGSSSTKILWFCGKMLPYCRRTFIKLCPLDVNHYTFYEIQSSNFNQVWELLN